MVLFYSRNSSLSAFCVDGYDYIDITFSEVREDWSVYNGDSNCLVGWDFGVRLELDSNTIMIGGSEGLTLDELCAWLTLDREKIAQNEEYFYQILLDLFGELFGVDLHSYGSLKDILLCADISIKCSSYRDENVDGPYYINISFADEIYAKCQEYGLL